MNYTVRPGLYAVGSPDADSPVLVSANYKMSFDILRRAMDGRHAWILVIDTKGINVWCAAGKGTFSADEVLRRTDATRLRSVSRGTIVLPQLSATGVRAGELQKRSGFRVVFGPVRARDLPSFLDNGLKATTEMRRVKFGIVDRLVLTPSEFVWSLKYLAMVVALLLILGAVVRLVFQQTQSLNMIASGAIALFGAILAGTLITPLLLPWIPGRPFSLKGSQVGLIWALVLIAYHWRFLSSGAFPGIASVVAALLFLPATTAYFALNFTGSSTYTSLSGVRKETRLALPLILGAVAIGGAFFIAGLLAWQTL